MLFAETVPGVPIDLAKFDINGPTALLILVLISGILAIVRGWVVPKPYYDREVQRGDDATTALQKTNEALEALTKEVKIRREVRSSDD